MHNPENTRDVADPAKYGYSEFHPRIWHGMTLVPWIGVLRGNISKIASRRILLVITVTIAACVNSIWALLVNIFYTHRVTRVKFDQQPIFILGYWRSGTTWLNELLICDKRYTFPKNFHCFSPKTYLLTRYFAWLLDLVMPSSRPMDKIDLAMDKPQEDEIAMLTMGFKTPYKYMAFPSTGAAQEDQSRLWPQNENEEKEWEKSWLNFLRAVQFLNPNKRLVLKSPPHTARIAMIKKLFPKAKFIHISRDPKALFASNIKMVKAMASTQGLENYLQTDAVMEDGLIEMHNRIYERFFDELDLIDKKDICFLRFEELRVDTKGGVEQIYKQLDLGEISNVYPDLQKYLDDKQDYKPDDYTLRPELEKRLKNEWKEYHKRFGY